MTHPVPVVLAGARGHGTSHLRAIRQLAGRGLVKLVGVCELTPLTGDELAGLGQPEQSPDLDRLVTRTAPRIVVLSTPMHTHAPLTAVAARHGAHVLVEKPPAPSYAEFEALAESGARGGVGVQIGFQSLGSHALPAIRELVERGDIGEPRGIGAAGAWVRDEAYWTRSPWSGKRTLDGRAVVDGALTNPLAHAVATALRMAGADRAEDVASVEGELYRINDIEADDTSCVRIRTTAGQRIVTAVTLCAEQRGEPYVVVHGSAGRVTFWYKTDRVRVERDGHPPETRAYGRTDLLTNLIEHHHSGAALLVPPERVGGFMRLVEAVRVAPAPVPLPRGVWRTETGAGGPRRVLPGVGPLTDAGAAHLALYSEQPAPWARPPWRADA